MIEKLKLIEIEIMKKYLNENKIKKTESFRNNKILCNLLIVLVLMIVSCSKNDDKTDPAESDFLSIPDIHFETKLIEQGIDSDGIVNKKMLKSDAENVTRLDLNLISNFGDIKDLSGIEGFTNITFLSASRQKIENIDLSFNTKLDTLDVSGNSISSIDVSHNTNLIFLDAQSNLLPSIIGLDKAVNLKDLDLSWNYFEDITVTNELLEVLHMSHNDLKTLNTDGLIHLQHVFIPLNKLETVDFTTNVALETLLMAGNRIEYVNLENNSNLTHLYISGNALKSLDVSNNERLLELGADRNPRLTCIKIQDRQTPYVIKSEYQELNNSCN